MTHPDQHLEAAIVAAGANRAPRVTPADIEANIVSEHYFTAADGVRQIANKLPRWTTDHEPVKEWLDIDPKTGIKVDESVDQWQAFNSITEALTHKGKNFNTTLSAFAQTDKLFFS